jgi:UDPglucose 6-dehydrogenase
MKLVVIGTGYVGLVAAACFAETGATVIGADANAAKIEGLKKNKLPIYEPGLDLLVERNQAAGRLQFTTDVASAVSQAEVIFIAVGTPQDEDGSADLTHVLAVAEMIGKNIGREAIVVTKSTVPVGTGEKVRAAVEKNARFPFHVVSNPEFLKEGAAVEDFLRPDRVVIGASSNHAREVMANLYAPFVRTGRPILFMDIPSAEMTKYAANAMLAARISFMNEVANLCELVGANVDDVRRGIGSDTRIGSSFLFPGPGYGGSCFPKDVQAFARTARDHGGSLRVVEATQQANEVQKHRLMKKLEEVLGTVGPDNRIAVWGLAFKPNTDDMREAPSLSLIDDLLATRASVVAHDPVALDEAKRILGNRITFENDSYTAINGADALIIVTDWNEYRQPDFERIRSTMRRPNIIDGRNLYSLDMMRRLRFTYASIGRETIKSTGQSG